VIPVFKRSSIAIVIVMHGLIQAAFAQELAALPFPLSDRQARLTLFFECKNTVSATSPCLNRCRSLRNFKIAFPAPAAAREFGIKHFSVDFPKGAVSGSTNFTFQFLPNLSAPCRYMELPSYRYEIGNARPPKLKRFPLAGID
jgi:hypothetical protein